MLEYTLDRTVEFSGLGTVDRLVVDSEGIVQGIEPEALGSDRLGLRKMLLLEENPQFRELPTFCERYDGIDVVVFGNRMSFDKYRDEVKKTGLPRVGDVVGLFLLANYTECTSMRRDPPIRKVVAIRELDISEKTLPGYQPLND